MVIKKCLLAIFISSFISSGYLFAMDFGIKDDFEENLEKVINTYNISGLRNLVVSQEVDSEILKKYSVKLKNRLNSIDSEMTPQKYAYRFLLIYTVIFYTTCAYFLSGDDIYFKLFSLYLLVIVKNWPVNATNDIYRKYYKLYLFYNIFSRMNKIIDNKLSQ